MHEADPVVIVGMARTPMGGLLGDLSSFSANELGAHAIKGAVADAGVSGEDIDLVYMGNCLPAGQGQAPARQAGIKATLPKSAEATTINKMCGSGMQAAVMGRNAILAGEARVVVDGGMVTLDVVQKFGPDAICRVADPGLILSRANLTFRRDGATLRAGNSMLPVMSAKVWVWVWVGWGTRGG